MLLSAVGHSPQAVTVHHGDFTVCVCVCVNRCMRVCVTNPADPSL